MKMELKDFLFYLGFFELIVFFTWFAGWANGAAKTEAIYDQLLWREAYTSEILLKRYLQTDSMFISVFMDEDGMRVR